METNLINFEVFLTVAECSSVTQAGKQLGISKAAVSRHIRLLEESTNLPLFNRTTRSITLTEAGEALRQQCLRLQHELETARNLISSIHKTPKGLLRISSSPYFGKQYLLPAIQKFMDKFPDVSVDLLCEERLPDMYKEQVDLVFGVTWPAPLDVVAKKISTTRYVLCAAKEYIKKHGMPKSIKGLDQHVYIAHASRAPLGLLPGLKNAKSITLPTKFSINNVELMKQAAINSLGIVALHDYVVAEELQQGKLIELLPDEFDPHIDVYVYYQKHRYVEPKIHRFIELILR